MRTEWTDTYFANNAVGERKKFMNQSTWHGKLRQLRGEFKREWGKFSHNDRQRLEGEIDRMLGQLQERYGYTSERAWHELENYWQDYGKSAKSAVNAALGKKKSKSFVRRIPWLTILVALGVITFLLRRRSLWLHPVAAPPVSTLTEDEKKRKESIRREKERDLVDEQSWESFPASDPPASW